MLTFDEEKHEYRWDGVVVPSVTTILSACGFYDYDHVSAETLNVAAERGRIVHKCIEWYEGGTLDVDSIDDELRGYFESYLKMREEGLLPYRPVATERRVFSKFFRYAGTLDQEFNRLPGSDDEAVWINDLKTGAPSPEHGLQLSAYFLADHDDLKEAPQKLTGTYLHADGTRGDLISYPYEPTVFLSIHDEYRWRLKNGKIRTRWR